MKGDKMPLKEKLLNIQTQLKAPKGQFNKFGGYKYRSCEDILEAVKPLLLENKCVLTITDTVDNIGDRFYIKAAAVLTDVESDESIINTAYARETDDKKGMDGSQITGTASSYARKYALNGLFLIDDTKDADTDEHAMQTGQDEKKATEKQIAMIEKLVDADKIPNLLKYYNVETLEDLTSTQASEVIAKKKGEKK
jgi:hypothetical protein